MIHSFSAGRTNIGGSTAPQAPLLFLEDSPSGLPALNFAEHAPCRSRYMYYDHDACTMTIVLAFAMIIVHACFMTIVLACTMIVVHACVMMTSWALCFRFENVIHFQGAELLVRKVAYTSRALGFQF